MKTYVISGVAGMTGNELARQILAEGNSVIGFDNFFASSMDTIEDLISSEMFVFYEYDINDAEQMASIKSEALAAKNRGSEIIYINCAAVVHTEHFYHINRTFETNVSSMRSFLEQAIEVGASTFINCSTSEVYSMCSYKEGGVKESDFILLSNAEHSQRTSYAAGKLLTEFFMKEAVDENRIRGCSIRFANVYSKNERFAKHIIPHILNSLYTTGKVTLLENSKLTRRTFLHNIDSCSAVLRLCETPSALDGTIYNVGTDQEVWILDLVKICADMLGINDPEITFHGYRESDPERRLLCTEKIRSSTTWIPKIDLKDGIAMCIEEMNNISPNFPAR